MRSQGLSCVWTCSEPFQAAFTLKRIMAQPKLAKELFTAADNCTDTNLADLLFRAGRTVDDQKTEIDGHLRYRAPRKMTRTPSEEENIKALEMWDALPAEIRAKEKFKRVCNNFVAQTNGFTAIYMKTIQGRKHELYKKYYGARKVEYPSQARSASGDIVTVIGPPLMIHNIPWSPATNGSRMPLFIQTLDYDFILDGKEDVKGEMVVRQSKIR